MTVTELIAQLIAANVPNAVVRFEDKYRDFEGLAPCDVTGLEFDGKEVILTNEDKD